MGQAWGSYGLGSICGIRSLLLPLRLAAAPPLRRGIGRDSYGGDHDPSNLQGDKHYAYA